MDTQIPAWHTRLPDAFKSNDDKNTHELREALAEAKAREAQAVDAQRVAEAAQQKAEQKAQAEADRADGAESFARALLDTHHITPAMQDLGIDPLVPTRADVEAIADVLADDWNTGTEIDSLDADTAVRDWATDRRLL